MTGTVPPDEALAAIAAVLDPPLTIVTAAADGQRAGCLVGFHSQSSIVPGRYSVWLSKANHTYQVAVLSSHLAIHFLTAADMELAERFGTLTGDRADKFAGLAVTAGPGGVPLLDQCASWLAVRRTAILDDGGDHACLAAEPVAASWAEDFRPLLTSDAAHLEPGHDSAERPGVGGAGRTRAGG
jgi:flavin reductase (DIM6/NTAB) family NADH-FMN oxidoreductase RutF